MAKQPPLANTITLGVRDLKAERAFYEALGWPATFSTDDFVVFELRGALLALFPIEKLADDAHAEAGAGDRGIRFSIIICVETAEEVSALAEQVRRAGGTVTKDPVDAEFHEGRSAYFTDPEGNYFEIAWAPETNPVVAAARRAAGLSGSRG